MNTTSALVAVTKSAKTGWVRTAFAIIISLGVAGIPVSTAQAAAASVSAVPSTATVSPGGAFDVGVRVSTDTPSRGMQFILSYDPAAVTLNSWTRGNYYTAFADANDGSVFWSPGSPQIDNVAGTFPKNTAPSGNTIASVVLLGASNPDGTLKGVTGAGDVYILHMSALAGASGTTHFTLSHVILADNGVQSGDLHAVVVDGQVTIENNPPLVTTDAAGDLATTGATLHGTLVALGTGATSASASFEYGTAVPYALSTPPQGMSAPGSVSSPISGLTANTTYHYRMKAVGPSGTGYGTDQTFTTLPQGAPLWSPMTSNTTEGFTGVWGSSASDAFAVGTNGAVRRYNGSQWSTMDSGTTEYLEGVWGASASDVFAVGHNGTVVHYDGNVWSPMNSGTAGTLTAVWGSSSTDVYAVGESGTILHYDGSAWSTANSGISTYLFGVWGTSPSDVYAVGGWMFTGGAILHYDGSQWTQMNSNTNSILTGVWGTSPSDVFAVGLGGAIVHYNGSAWSTMNSGTSVQLEGVWGRSSNDVFAVGGYGTIVGATLHYDGASWRPLDSGTPNLLNSVYGASQTDIIAVGQVGTVLHLFTPVLTMAVTGSGATSPVPGSRSYLFGETVILTATPGPGWVFGSWSGNVTNTTANVTSAIMDSNKGVTARFTPTAVFLCDVNGDRTVNVLDLISVGSIIGQSGAPGWTPEDIVQDGVINVLDLITVGSNIGRTY